MCSASMSARSSITAAKRAGSTVSPAVPVCPSRIARSRIPSISGAVPCPEASSTPSATRSPTAGTWSTEIWWTSSAASAAATRSER